MGLNNVTNKVFYFSISLFILCIIFSLIPEYQLGRKLKGILVYTTLLLSIVCSLGTIPFMFFKKERSLFKIILLSIPSIYLFFIIMTN